MFIKYYFINYIPAVSTDYIILPGWKMKTGAGAGRPKHKKSGPCRGRGQNFENERGRGRGLMFGKGEGPGPGWGSPMKKSTRIDPRPGRPRPHLQHLTVYYMLILNNPRYMLRRWIACVLMHVVKMAITSYIIYIILLLLFWCNCIYSYLLTETWISCTTIK